MAHSCSREDCPPTNIAGPKIKCAECPKLCYLMCFGFSKHSEDFLKITITNGAKIVIEISSLNFVCAQCETTGLIVSSRKTTTNALTNSLPITQVALKSNKSKDENHAGNDILSSIIEIKAALKINYEQIQNTRRIISENLDISKLTYSNSTNIMKQTNTASTKIITI